MASIGDLYFTFRGDGARLTADAKKEGTKAGNAAGTSFAGRMKASIGKAFSGTKGGLLAGLGLGAGLGAIGLATQALGKLTDVMGDAVAAAIEEEKSIAKLDAALAANVEGYNGNTEAIEEQLAARMRLGFADDEQRESLALLVAATKDSTKALKIQRVAMDLARLKNISLTAASEALVKVEGGQFRILKSLGIQLPKNATATEALAAVTKVASGQAEAYAETSGGKLLAAQIKVGEAMEKLGTRLLPIVVAATEGASEAVETLALTFDGLADILDSITKGELPKTEEETLALVDRLADVAESVPLVGVVFKEMAGNTIEDMLRMTANADYMKDHVKDDMADTGDAFVTLGVDATEMEEAIHRAAVSSTESIENFRDDAIDAARDIVTKAYQIIEDKAALTAINVEKAELAKVIATDNATKEQKDRFKELTEAQTGLILDLATNGQDQSKVVKDALVQLNDALKTSHGQEKKAIQAVIDALKLLAKQAKTTKRLVDGVSKGKTQKSGPLEYADGGWVNAPPGKPVRATVHGGEYVLSQADVAAGIHLPNIGGAPSAAPMSSVAPSSPAGGKTINVNLLDRMGAQTPRDISDGLRMLGERGYL